MMTSHAAAAARGCEERGTAMATPTITTKNKQICLMLLLHLWLFFLLVSLEVFYTARMTPMQA